eukprot:scaffold220062_cov15-Prasinocladus_malaysianus.AAC.1
MASRPHLRMLDTNSGSARNASRTPAALRADERTGWKMSSSAADNMITVDRGDNRDIDNDLEWFHSLPVGIGSVPSNLLVIERPCSR